MKPDRIIKLKDREIWYVGKYRVINQGPQQLWTLRNTECKYGGRAFHCQKWDIFTTAIIHREDGPAYTDHMRQRWFYYGREALPTKKFHDETWRKSILIKTII